jgi:hypothetical protein
MVANFNAYVHSNYYTGTTLEPGVKYEETVSLVKERLFPDDLDPTPILAFESGKELPLNQTNLRTVIAAFGPNPANVIGKKIVLFREMVEFGGKKVPGVRINCVTPATRSAVAADPSLRQERKAIGSAPAKGADIGSGKARWEREVPPPSADEPLFYDDVPFPTEEDYRGDDREDRDDQNEISF